MDQLPPDRMTSYSSGPHRITPPSSFRKRPVGSLEDGMERKMSADERSLPGDWALGSGKKKRISLSCAQCERILIIQ